MLFSKGSATLRPRLPFARSRRSLQAHPLFRAFETFLYFLPVHYIPPCFQIVGADIFVLQVVGMLPDIIAHDGIVALHQRIILIGGAGDFQLSRRGADQPRPSAAEALEAGIVELVLEFGKAAEGLFNGISQRARGLASGLGRHDLPEHAVVHVPTAVVAHGGAYVFWYRV